MNRVVYMCTKVGWSIVAIIIRFNFVQSIQVTALRDPIGRSLGRFIIRAVSSAIHSTLYVRQYS